MSVDIAALDKAGELVESADKIFESKLGNDSLSTFNVYLILMHIRINLKNYAATKQPESYMVEFSGNEPTIGAAVEFTGLQSETKIFKKLKK